MADAAVAPTLASIERSMERHKVKNRPPLPGSRQDLNLPAILQLTTDGRQFVLIDDGTVDRILVFATHEQMTR